MESSGGRRRRSVVESPNLGDFLRIKEDEGPKSLSGQTLSAVLANEKRPSRPVQVNRTLLDIIRDDPNCSKESKKTWKAFKDKIRLRRPAAAWTSTQHTPASDIPLHNANTTTNSMIYRSNLIRFNPSSNPTSSQLSSSSSNRLAQLNSIMNAEFNSIENGSVETVAPDQRGEEEEDEEEEGEGETEELLAEGVEEGGEVPVRMSLMALLAETDRQMGVDGSNFVMEDDDEEEEEDECIVSTVVEYNNCCVCMVRDKGSAFIPCGHTFCRLCSRELWVQRGNCPLCNGFILEILDIF